MTDLQSQTRETISHSAIPASGSAGDRLNPATTGLMFTRVQRMIYNSDPLPTAGAGGSIPLLLLILLLQGCGDLTDYDEQQVRSAMHDSLITTAESWDVEISLLDEGRRRLYLQGSYAIDYRQADRKETRIQGPVYIQIYDTVGTLESEAWSMRAVYHPNEREFELFDSVRVETVNNRRLISDYLHWNENSDQITSDRHVTIITPSDSLSGSGFEGKSDLSTYILTDPRGRVIVD